MLSGEEITRLRPGHRLDVMSGEDDLVDWSIGEAAPIFNALLAPGTTDDFPDVDVSGLWQLATLYLPAGSDVQPGDRVVARGETWDVTGRPSVWSRPGVHVGGIVVQLRLWEGR